MRLRHRQQGERVPEASFRIRENEEWHDLTYDEVFSGRTVVLFALPGAFTPTCTSTNLLGFAMHADEQRIKGIDGIYCLSVNNWFVMDAWSESLKIGDEVTM